MGYLHIVIGMILSIIQRIPKFRDEDLYLFHRPLKHSGEQEESPAFATFDTVVVVPHPNVLHCLFSRLDARNSVTK